MVDGSIPVDEVLLLVFDTCYCDSLCFIVVILV